MIFLKKIPIKYNPNADCPKIKEFINQIMREEDVVVLQELAGYCLWKDYPIQKAFALVGEGSNGKSTFLRLLTKLLGKENVSSISLQDLVNNRFAVANLYGKLANIFADLPPEILKDTAKFKMLTGGDIITAEKKFKNPFKFYNYAKLIFSCNRLPVTYDDTTAFFRRWVIINFPNTFDGVVIGTKAIPGTSVKLGYLYRQKLRDHAQAHSPLVYGDANSSSANMPQWSENDDSAMHRGLTYTRLKAAGISTHAPLIVGDIHNRSVEGLKIDASFYAVPEIVSQVMGELNYRFDLSKTLSIAPGLRYIRQFDNGGGSVGGAALLGQLAGKSGSSYGYKEADSLDSQMIAAKIVAKIDNYALNLAYSMVFDEADLVTPWRAFPTSGYTRSMGRYNWFANTKSYRIKLTRNANSTGIYKDLFTELSVLYTDADENKYVAIGNVNLKYADQIYYYAGFVQNLPSMPELQWRLRLGYNDTDLDGWDNLDARFELNYLF